MTLSESPRPASGLAPDPADQGIWAESRRLVEAGDCAQAIAVLSALVSAHDQDPSPDHLSLALALGDWAWALARAGRPAAGWPLGERALEIAERHTGSSSVATAWALTRLTTLAAGMQTTDLLQRGVALGHRAIAIMEARCGADSPSYAESCSSLGSLYWILGRYTDSVRWHRDALDIWGCLLADTDPVVGRGCIELALDYREQGRYDQAAALFDRAQLIYSPPTGAPHPDLWMVLNHKGRLNILRGAFPEAEECCLQALEMATDSNGAVHASTAACLSNLGMIAVGLGRTRDAEKWFMQARLTAEAVYGPIHPRVAGVYSHLGTLRQNADRFDEAADYHERALAIYQREFGEAHPEVARCCHNLGELHRVQGHCAQAASWHERGLSIRESVYQDPHKELARSHGLLAQCQLYCASRSQTESHVATARRMLTALGLENHRDSTELDTIEIALALRQNEAEPLAAALQRAASIESRILETLEYWGSEGAKQQFAAVYWSALEKRLGIPFWRGSLNPALIACLAEELLDRKGRVLDSLLARAGALRGTLDSGCGELAALEVEARRDLARFVYSEEVLTPAERCEQRAILASRLDTLEAELSLRSAAYAGYRKPITLNAVTRTLTDDSVLIEVVQYRPYQFEGELQESARWLPPRYAAFIVCTDLAPAYCDLGESHLLDLQIDVWRRAVLAGRNVVASSRAIDKLFWEPLAGFFTGKSHVYLAPDGALSRVPLGALLGPDGRFRLESWTINYLSTGGEMVRWASRNPATGPCFVLGAPDFDAETQTPTEPAHSPTKSIPSAGAKRVSYPIFASLPWSAREATQVATRLSTSALTGPQATVSRLISLETPPKVMHLATHAIFGVGDSDALSVVAPMLQAGIALAGANRRDPAHSGILTALEACHLNLWGTQLVVLSACDTGVGVSHAGEGVYGLRRALALAGSRAQVLCLWSVEDEATEQLMVRYYDRLLAGEGPAQALRNVQLEALEKGVPLRAWAPFVASGCSLPIR